MDVAYSVKRDPTGKYDELRMSLRSLHANGRNLDRVFLVGSWPDWASDRVFRVPCASPYDLKQKNILYAMFAMCDAVGRPFLYSSDDHFMLKECDLNAFPWYRRLDGLPDEEHYRRKGVRINAYRGSMVATRALLERNGMPTEDVSGHVNTHIDPADAGSVGSLVGRYWETKYGYEPSTVFIACARRRIPVELVPRRDVKFKTVPTPADLERAGGFASTHDGAPLGWLRDMFPDPSPYEKT